MRRLVLACLAASLALAAEAQPREPSRDYAAAYRLEGQGAAVEMRVFYSAATRRQRVETPEGGMAMIHDVPNGRMLMLSAEARMVMVMPMQRGEQTLLAVPDDVALTRSGTATVAGHRCTLYRAARAGREGGTVCLSEDGIVLAAEWREEGGRGGRAEATSLTLAPQPAALFEPPQGWQVVQMPAGAPQGPQPGQRRQPR